jgi:prepilin-type N-terminal cleavage/methylation domain-containing protein
MRLHPSHSAARGFTLIELLTVITIIMVLVGMIIGVSGLVQTKQARAGAEAQIQAMSAAIESYKVDNATVPREENTTDKLNSKTSVNPTSGYAASSLYLYKALSGDRDANRKRDVTNEDKSYMQFKPGMLLPTDPDKPVTSIADPFGYSYGYSTAANKEIEDGATAPTKGFNPTFDLWSTAGGKTTNDKEKWVKNW